MGNQYIYLKQIIGHWLQKIRLYRCLHSLTESSATLLSGTKQLGQPTSTLPPTSTGRRWKIVLFAGSTRLLHSKGIGQRKKLLICQGNLIPIFQAPLRFALDAESQSYREPGRSERKFEAIMADEKVIDLTDVDFLLSPDCRTCQEPTKRVTGKTFDLEGHGMVGVMYGCDNYRCKECKDRKCSYLLELTRM